VQRSSIMTGTLDLLEQLVRDERAFEEYVDVSDHHAAEHWLHICAKHGWPLPVKVVRVLADRNRKKFEGEGKKRTMGSQAVRHITAMLAAQSLGEEGDKRFETAANLLRQVGIETTTEAIKKAWQRATHGDVLLPRTRIYPDLFEPLVAIGLEPLSKQNGKLST
jgi:hypothetical protein